MAVFKVVARCPKRGVQVKKKVYETNDKYKKYASDLIFRWSEMWDLEIYDMKDEEYRLWYTIKTPQNEKELRCMQEERKYSDTWLKYKLRSL